MLDKYLFSRNKKIVGNLAILAIALDP